MKLKKAFFLVVALVFLVSFTKAVSDIEVGAQVAQVNLSTPSSQEVVGFTLINPATGAEIGPLTEGYNIDLASLGLSQIDIKANTTPATVGSVRFYLDSGSPRTRNSAPYLYGPTSIDAGTHSIVATPYTLPRGRGTEGIPKTVNFNISSGQSSQDGHSGDNAGSSGQDSNSATQTNTDPVHNTAGTDTNTSGNTNVNQSGLAVTSFTLVNADTNEDIRTLQNGETIDISQTPNISIKANTNPATVGSVRFWVNQEVVRTENVIPYSLAADGDNGLDYYAWDYPMGQVTITAIPSELPRFRGTQGQPLSIILNIVNGEGDNSNLQGEAGNRGADNLVEVVACIDAVVGYNPNTNPQGYINATWPAVSTPGVAYRVYRNGSMVVQGQQNTSYSTTWLSPGNWTIGVSVISGGVESAITSITVPVSSSGSEAVYQNCGGGHNENTAESIIISSPSANSNVVIDRDFEFSVQGNPSDDGIDSVDFYLSPGFGGLNADPVLLGTDSTSPFSIQASVSERYYRCPNLYAIANMNDGTQIKTSANGFHPVAITDSPTNNPWQCTPQSIGGSSNDFKITEPAWAATSDPGYNAGTPFTISAENNVTGATVNYVNFYTADDFDGLTGWDFNLVATDTTSPYSTQATIDSPADYGHPYFTNHVRAIAYYSNGQVESRYVPVKINPSPDLPEIQNLQVVNTQGVVLDTLTSGDTINIGSQGGGYGTNIALKANVNTVMPAPGSVKFVIESTGTPYERIENAEPYASHGDSNGNYAPWAGVAPGAYTLKVTPYTGVNATGSAGPTLTIPVVVVNNDDTTPPPVPTNVAINFRSANEVRLSWNASADAVSYKVYRNPGGVATLGNVTSFIDSSASGSSAYNYQVTALDAAGNESSLSSVTSSPALSNQYSNGSSVQVANGFDAAVYNQLPNPGTPNTQNSGSQGVIQGTSVYWNGQPYWFVNFNTGADGWVIQSFLAPQTTPPPTGNDPVVTTPKRGLAPEEFAIVYNSADGYSQTVANNYAQARGIPSSNIIGLNFNPASYDSTSISYGDFNNYNGTGLTMRQYVLNQLNNPNIQGFILAFNQPARVNACMSVVSAFAMDFNNAHCSGDLTNNPYFESSSLTPRTTYNYMPTMALAGDSVSEATTYFNRGISADNSYPNGEVYLLTTRDNDRSQSRYSDFTTLEGVFNQSNLGTTHQVDPLYTGSGGQQIVCNSTPSYPNSYLSGVNNVLGYHTGLTCVPSLSTLTFLPGAPADHLTSYGGWLPITNPGDLQMPISDWIENGATIASGTVKEPWIVGGYTELGYKFPKASTFWKEYYTGATAVEAYQKSVRETGITNFLGEPLASPWKDPQITFSNNTLTIGITHIKPGQTWKLQSSTNGSTWSDVSGQTNITAPNGKYGLRTITVTNATAPYYRLVDTANTNLPQVQRPVNGNTGGTGVGGNSNAFSAGDIVIVNDGTN